MSETYNVPRFDGVIGQDTAKRKLNFYIDSYEKAGLIPNLMFTAPKGCGKTMLATALAKELVKDGDEKPKRYIEVNCSTLKNVKKFFDELIIPHLNDRDVTILFDEASEIPQDVEMALLTILNPNPRNRTSFSYDDYTVDFDFRRQTFLFATSEPHKVFHALMDRLDRIDLEEYNYTELGTIVQINLPEIKFEDGLLDEIASVLRGNARAAQKMAIKIQMYLDAKGGGEQFTRKDWSALTHTLGIRPLGLRPKEVEVLRILQTSRDVSLTRLGSKTGMTPESLRRDYELYLQKNDLMEITTAGRNITPQGKQYLEAMFGKEEV
jgi:Holliday junction resolvasome RuvABC ATP-dependent DNA helicase subunit